MISQVIRCSDYEYEDLFQNDDVGSNDPEYDDNFVLDFDNLFKRVNLHNEEEKLSEESCDSVENRPWFDIKHLATCFKNKSSISSPNFVLSLSKELDVKVFNFNRNSRLHYLPIHSYKSVPNLLVIDAGHSNIKAIYKTNFEKLDKLIFLYLYYNNIETIPDGVFEDLVSLVQISLGKLIVLNFMRKLEVSFSFFQTEKNKIFSVEGNIFPPLIILTHVDFRSNPCIDELFTKSNFKSLTMSKVISSYCSVCRATNCDVESKITETTNFLAEKIQTFVEAHEANTLLNLAQHELEQAKTQIISLTNSKSELLETKLSLKSEVELLHSKFNQMNTEIETMRKEMRKEKVSTEKLVMKNENLLSEIQQLTSQNFALQADLTISQEKLEISKTVEDQMESFVKKFKIPK